MSRRLLWLLVFALLAACVEMPAVPATPAARPAHAALAPSPTVARTAGAVAPGATAEMAREQGGASQTPAPTTTPTPLPPLPSGELRCGIRLPIRAPDTLPETTQLPVVGSVTLEAIPEAARPAVLHMLDEPGNVGLVAYELGREEEGVYLNPDHPFPLASVVKLVHLITYAEAVQNGELDPEQPILLDELDRFYLANSDLRAHPDALADLRAEGRVYGDPPAVRLADVPRMMMQYSSNAATDYLHVLLGQERLEATILALGMSSHTAPCPFLGQFLLMTEGHAAALDYFENPERYAADVMAATLAYSGGDAAGTSRAWRGRAQRPEIETQAVYSELFNSRASAGDYARLMGMIAENQFGPWEQNVRIRSYLEWPTAFSANQQTLAWLGYKGGSLPGVLTAAYYAQPWDRARPVVVALFFHDLPATTYRQWRRTLPNDELARWLLYERDAISTLHAILSGGAYSR
ncbi:MAG: serine hydrolase [Anaerolineae bacterium]|nr:serine hydrolase [Anaerolineae bacterium]